MRGCSVWPAHAQALPRATDSVDASGSVPAVAASGVIEFLDFAEAHELHSLDNKLGNSHPALDLKGLFGIVINKAHLNLTAILRIDGARRVDHGNPVLGRQARTRVDQTYRAHWQGKSNASADERAFSGAQSSVMRGVEIRASIATMGSLRQRKLLIKALDLNVSEWTYRIYKGVLLIHAAQPTLSSPSPTPRDGALCRVYRAYPAPWVALGSALPRRLDSEAMTSNSSPVSPTASAESPVILYRERQWVPWYWWFMAAFVVAISTATVSLNRGIMWVIIPAILLSAIAVWVLVTWSNTVVQVEQDADGTRWLTVKDAQLPSDVVSRSTAVPATARRNALGPQLDPAAFLVTHGWVPEHVMLVLDDPEDPTPYWLIGSTNPEKLLAAFLPEQAAAAQG